MSVTSNINLLLTETAEGLEIYNTPANFTPAEKQAVKEKLEAEIKAASCEPSCPHRTALGMLESL